MRRKIILLLALLAIAVPVDATPAPPVLAVNHDTKQCAEVIQGDDCHWCDPAEGWEIVGYNGPAECPAGYRDLGSLGMAWECRGYKNQFCCSDTAHHGDCEDLVINESAQQCAFVEEIRGCTLPEGWVSAGDTTEWAGRCPFRNQWVSDLTCVTDPEPATPTATPHAIPTTAVAPAPTATQEPVSEGSTGSGFAWGVAIVLGLFLAVGWFILQRKRQT